MNNLSAYLSIPALCILLMGCATPLTNAAGEGNLIEVKALLDKGDICRQKPSLACDYAADPNERDGNNFTPLIMAAMNGHTAVARLLLERGADVNKSFYLGGEWVSAGMPIVYAACPYGRSKGHLETAWVLVEKGADVDSAMQYVGNRFNYGLWYRTCYENLKVAKLGSPRPLPADPIFTFTGFKMPAPAPSGSVPLTVVIVEPDFDYLEKESKLAHKYRKILKSFAARVGTSFDELFIAKGLTTRGPYITRDFVPYPDKKGSNLTFTQTMYISVDEIKQLKKGAATYQTKDGNVPAEVRTSVLSIEGWIALEMREPLSGEKMLVKKLDFGINEYEYQKAYKMALTQTAPSSSYGEPATGVWVGTNEELFDTSVNAVADYLSKAYPEIMRLLWTSFSPEEMSLLDKKGDEIRALKVYSTAP